MILDDVAFLEQWLYFNQEHILSYIFPLWIFEAKSRWLHNTRWCAKARSISCCRLASPTGHQMCSNMRLGETKLDQSEGKGCQNITEIIRVSIDLAPPRSRKHPSRNSVCSWRLWKDDGSETMQLASDTQNACTHTHTHVHNHFISFLYTHMCVCLRMYFLSPGASRVYNCICSIYACA
jgi:hypothetical protein